MSKADKEQFVRFLSERSKRKERRNIALFKALINGKEASLKLELGDNTYNVLKLRLTESLSEFMSGIIFESELTQESHIIRTLVLARKMLQLEKITTGRKLLLKAEKKAREIQHYTLLNEIYHSLIEISHEASFSDHEKLIQKLEINTRNFVLQERLNLVFAQVKRSFLESEQGQRQIDLNSLIEENFAKYGISEASGYGLKSLYQLATIIDFAAAKSRTYHSIDLFFADKIQQLSLEEKSNARNHLYHIDLLYLLANIHFRRRAFRKSMHYLDQMHDQLKAFNQRYYSERIIKHQLLTALNLNFLGNADQALEILGGIKFKSTQDSQERLQVVLTQIMLLAQQGQIKEANMLMKKLYRTDAYYKRIAGLEWIINKRFLEIILIIESGDFDFAYSRIDNFLRQQKSIFEEHTNTQIKPFLALLKHYLNQPESIHTKDFHQLVETSIPWKASHEDDIFFISAYAWLKAKMTNSSIYAVTLQLAALKNNETEWMR
ncbi:MAG: hypothetical protein ACFHU9_16850 [Fluviicola sp.]